MITTQSSTLNRLFQSPLRTSVLATLVSLAFASVINFVFLSPQSLGMTLLITLVISAPMSYLTIRIVITLRSTIEDQKVKLALERERAEILSKFIRDAAHEFKTPLTLMASNLYLAEKTLDPEKKQSYTERTHQQIQTLNTMLDMILILTRLDGTTKAAYLRESLKTSDIITDLRSFGSTQRIKLQVDNVDTLPQVRVNLPDLHLAMKEIIGNALRFSSETNDVNVRAASEGQWLSIEISDQGQGMSTETLLHIFDRFYRQDDSHTTRGLGLGLAIAKRVLELHDGHIEVESEPGKGTTVTAFLPTQRIS